MRRRTFLVATAALTAQDALFGQVTQRVYRIAILNDGNEETRKQNWDTFHAHLKTLGLVEGKNVVVDVRYARGRNDLLPKLAAELVSMRVDIIVSAGTPASHAAKAATTTIPLVFLAVGDPVGTGLVKSLARPGGNGTGVSVVTTEIAQKSIELLRELVPGIQRVAYMGDPSNPAFSIAAERLKDFARKINLNLWLLDGADPVTINDNLDVIRRERIQGLHVDSSGRVLIQREMILAFVASKKVPTVYGRHDYTDVGGLMSYETDRRVTFERGAELVNRILKGAKPGDLPVEQTSKFRMVINMKAARAQGITIPASLRLRADEVNE